jgi:hypothetical protein
LHQKYPCAFKKNIRGVFDNVYQNGDAFLKAQHGQGVKQMIQGQTVQIILAQGQNQNQVENQGLQYLPQAMENGHSVRPCSPFGVTRRPASPYRRTEELQAQLMLMLNKKDSTASRTSDPSSLKERMRQHRDAVRQSREPAVLRKKVSDPSALRSKSSGASSIRERLEHNKESMKKLTQNSPFVKSRSNSLDNSTWGIYHDSEPMNVRLTSQGRGRKSLPGSMNQYVYKQSSSNQNRPNIRNPGSQGSRTSSSRSSVFNGGQTLPIRRSDQPGVYRDIDSDSAVDSDSIHSMDGASGTEDEVLLQMLCNDLVKGTNGASQFVRGKSPLTSYKSCFNV